MAASSRMAAPAISTQGALRVTEIHVRSVRLDCVDVLRGIVLVLMVLDHTRDFFTGLQFSPENLAHTSGPLFFTRFITHFCAPAFFLLAGMGAYLFRSQGRSTTELSRFLWTRGFWLLVIHLVATNIAWNALAPFCYTGVLWSLGWSMVLMAPLVQLPVVWVAGVGTTIIVTHNLLDRVNPEVFGLFEPAWKIVHGFGMIWVNSGNNEFMFVLFSISPWVGVMAIGYALGALLRRPDWRKLFVVNGAAMTVAFVLLRFAKWANGPMGPWAIQATPLLTVISFFNTSKYPASLQFLMMTLGPALMLMPWLDRVKTERGLGRILRILGRVPLFLYVMHLFLIHILAVIVARIAHQPSNWLIFGGPLLQVPPPGYGHGLPFIYMMWGTILILLYWPCKWFMGYKQAHPGDWWLRYL